MNKTERIARLYAAWLLIYGDAPTNADPDLYDDAVGTVIDEILTGTGVQAWQIYPRWEDCKDL